MEVANEHGLKSVAFPSISTGAYGYPIADAARTALLTVKSYLEQRSGIELVRFVLFSAADLQQYERALGTLGGE